ncbi:MAG: hypothetical protein AAF567_21595 [Actinomycetota bacterium]
MTTQQLFESHATRTRLGVLAWPELEGEDLPTTGRHDPRSLYVEMFWLPVLGPSSLLLLRRLAQRFDAEPRGFEIDCAQLSREIGLGPRLTPRAPFVRTVDRCIKFQLATLSGDLLHVRRTMPNLTSGQQRALTEPLRRRHAMHTSPNPRVRPVPAASG